MGSGNYSFVAYASLASDRGYATKSADAVFTNHSLSAKSDIKLSNVDARTYNTQIKPEMVDTDSQIDVFNPGGMVKTKVHYDNNEYWIELTGNATFTHQITIYENDLHRNNLENVQISETNEQQAYEHFVDSLPKYNDITTLA